MNAQHIHTYTHIFFKEPSMLKLQSLVRDTMKRKSAEDKREMIGDVKEEGLKTTTMGN